MCHQPFETWIIEETTLTPQEQKLFEEHLEGCAQCARLKASLQAVHVKLTTARQVSPPAGFGARWQVTLQTKLEEERMKQVLQVRRFFLFLGTANVMALVLLVISFLIGGGNFNWLSNTFARLSTVTQWLDGAKGFFFALLHITSPVLPLTIWIIITTVFSILALIWVVSLWRITIQGVKSR